MKNNIKKILILSQLFYPDTYGGSEKVVYCQAKELVARGFDVTVLVRKNKERLLDEEVVDGIKVLRYKSRMNKYWGKSLTDIFVLPKIIKELYLKEKFDLAILHHSFSGFGFFNAGINKPAIYIFHASYWREVLLEGIRKKFNFEFLNQWINILFSILVKLVERKSLARADKIIVLSEFSKIVLQETYNIEDKKISIIPAGVDLEEFSPTSDKKEIRKRLDLREDRVVFLSIRRLVGRMGLENLILAMKKLKDSHPNAILLIGGRGSLRKKLEIAVENFGLEDNVKFLGFVKNKDLVDYYRACDAFILPTLAFEGFGMVTLEALACGIPVLGTPAGATPEILEKINSDYIFKDAGATEIYEGIKKFLDEDQGNGNLVNKLRYFVEENYTWSKSIDLLVCEIEKVLDLGIISDPIGKFQRYKAKFKNIISMWF